MQHLAIWLSRDGLQPYRVTFDRPESPPVPSMREEGWCYRHPPIRGEAIVWAPARPQVPEVLMYHYGRDYSNLVIWDD